LVTVNLDTPFIYDGNNNLLICFYTPVANFVGSYGNMFYYTNTYTNTEENIYSSMALYSSSYIDFTNIDYDFVAWANYNFRANIQIDITPIMSIPFTENFTTSSPPRQLDQIQRLAEPYHEWHSFVNHVHGRPRLAIRYRQWRV
jgi:hypothetical protein